MTTVFLHGLGQTPKSWDGTIGLLPPDENSHCPDLLGLITDKESTFQNLYAAFSAYCDALPGKLRLCGLSLGGVLALQYAIEHPDRMDSLVLIGAQYRPPKGLLILQNLIFRFMPEKTFQEIGLGKKDFISLCASMMDIDLSQALKRIPCPTLVLCGENDSANKKAALGLSDGISGSKLMFVPQAGHALNKDCPEKLAEILGDFWNGTLSE